MAAIGVGVTTAAAGGSRRRRPEQCPCCGFYTLTEVAATPGRVSTPCPVCHWISDLHQECDPGFSGRPNYIDLRAARKNYERIGAIHERARPLVRPPRPEERIDPWQRSLQAR